MSTQATIEQDIAPRGASICDQLVSEGVSTIAWLPASETHFMNAAIAAAGFQIVQVCKEGEAIAICAGVHLAGKRGAVLIENQGLYESGNVLKWTVGLRLPIVVLVGCPHYEELVAREDGTLVNPNNGAVDYTDRFLTAFNVPHVVVKADDDVPLVGEACRRAHRQARPIAVLLASADGYQAGT
jgi:sulfopyruvate decarboxylase TPP-binding subunit